jgi:predicted ArsR family transcriptional regulator
MKAIDRILYLLKTRGPQTTQFLADDLQLTSMGVRRHLDHLLETGLLCFDEQSKAHNPGRPTRYWALTERGHQRFPDRHSDLNLQLIQQVKNLFGDEGLDRLIQAREHQALEIYQARMGQVTEVAGVNEGVGAANLADKIAALAQVRCEEGYMAQVQQDANGTWLLSENHCPICAAAKECQQFCRSELAMFQTLLQPLASVAREEHLLSGARRCAYRIVAISSDVK